jgi:hypothetical protein
MTVIRMVYLLREQSSCDPAILLKRACLLRLDADTGRYVEEGYLVGGIKQKRS